MNEEIKILFVEDDPDILRGTVRVLQGAGYVVDTAGSGEQALEIIRNSPPDLLLLDCDLPGKNGFDVCRQIKRDPQLSEIIVVLISNAMGNSLHQMNGLSIGADGFIARPVSNQELVVRLKSYLPMLDINRSLRRQAAALQKDNQVLVGAKAELEQSFRTLLDKEALLTATQELTRSGGWEWDVDTRMMTWTRETYRIHEMDMSMSPDNSAELIARSVECYMPSDRPFILAAFNKCVDEGEPYDLEFPFVTVKGKPLWIRTMACAIKQDGRVVKVRGNIVDITERKRAEDALKRSETLFRFDFERAPVGRCLVQRDGRFIKVNPVLCSMLGYSEEELLGKTVGDVTHPDDVDSSIDAVQQVVSGTREYLNLEKRYVQKSGTVIWGQVWASLARNDDGSPLFLMAHVRDVTEQKIMSDVLAFLARNSGACSGEDFFKSLACYLGEVLGMDYVCIDRLDGDCLAAQTLAVYNDKKFEENVHYTLMDTPCGEVVKNEVCCYPSRVCQHFPRDLVLQDMKAESYVGTTLWGNDGSPIGLVAVIGKKPLANPRLAQSILRVVGLRASGELERKIAEDALRASLEEKTALLKEVHHRVKNNLQIVISLMNLQAGRKINPEVLACLNDTRNRVRSMALLHESLYRSGNMSGVHLNEYLQSLCMQLLRASEAAPSRIKLECHIENVFLTLDQAVPCGLIVNELVTNALKHAFPNDRHGVISVGIHRADNHQILLSVKDDGVGLPPEKDPLHCGSLGLQLVSLLAKQMHGSLEVKNDGGARFDVQFKNETETNCVHAGNGKG